MEEWDGWNRKIADQEALMEYHFNWAIELARESYGICWPQCESGAVKNGPFEKLESRFNPVFKEPFFLNEEQNVEYRAAKAPDGSWHYLDAPLEAAFGRKVMGTTWDDGQVVIRAELFKAAEENDSPGILGGELYYQQVQHEKLVKEGWKSAEETALHAYTAEFKAAGVFKLPTEYQADIKTQMAINARLLLAAKRNDDPGLLSPPFVTPDLEDKNQGFLEGAQSRLDGIRMQQMQLKLRLEEKARERRERDNEEIRAGLRRQYFDTSRDVLAGMARRTCAGPGRMTERDLLNIRRAYQWFEEYRSIEPKTNIAHAAADGLAGCPAELVLGWMVWEMTGREGGRLRLDDYNAKSREIAGKYPAAPPAGPGGGSPPEPGNTPDRGGIDLPTLDDILGRLKR